MDEPEVRWRLRQKSEQTPDATPLCDSIDPNDFRSQDSRPWDNLLLASPHDRGSESLQDVFLFFRVDAGMFLGRVKDLEKI
jgi:hypothetical protein